MSGDVPKNEHELTNWFFRFKKYYYKNPVAIVEAYRRQIEKEIREQLSSNVAHLKAQKLWIGRDKYQIKIHTTVCDFELEIWAAGMYGYDYNRHVLKSIIDNIVELYTIRIKTDSEILDFMRTNNTMRFDKVFKFAFLC